MRASFLLAAAFLTGCLASAPPPGEDTASPAGPEVGKWIAADCVGLSAVWTPPLDLLQEVVGPRWTPAAGPLPERGVFVLFAVAPGCATTVNGNATADATIGVAIVRIAAPENARGLDVDSWSVVPEAVGDPAAPHVQLFAEAGFAVVPGDVTVELQPTAAGIMTRSRIATENGTVEIEAVVGGESAETAFEAALANAGEGPVGIFTGMESAVGQESGTAVVRSTGDTWVSRLSLEPRPFAISLDREFSWDFTFLRYDQ